MGGVVPFRRFFLVTFCAASGVGAFRPSIVADSAGSWGLRLRFCPDGGGTAAAGGGRGVATLVDGVAAGGTPLASGSLGVRAEGGERCESPYSLGGGKDGGGGGVGGGSVELSLLAVGCGGWTMNKEAGSIPSISGRSSSRMLPMKYASVALFSCLSCWTGYSAAGGATGGEASCRSPRNSS